MSETILFEVEYDLTTDDGEHVTSENVATVSIVAESLADASLTAHDVADEIRPHTAVHRRVVPVSIKRVGQIDFFSLAVSKKIAKRIGEERNSP